MKKGNRWFAEFSEEKKKVEGNRSHGRRADLLKQRNDKLFHRFYFRSRILHKKYELVLLALVTEFDLAE